MRSRAMKCSAILPKSMKEFLGSCDNTKTGKVLKVLAELTDRTGLESALSPKNQALLYRSVMRQFRESVSSSLLERSRVTSYAVGRWHTATRSNGRKSF